MGILREYTIGEVVKFLQPAKLPPDELWKAVEREFIIKEKFDEIAGAEELFDPNPSPLMKVGLQKGNRFVKIAGEFLKTLNALDYDFREKIDVRLQENKLGSEYTLKLAIEEAVHAVDQHKNHCKPKRSGGSVEARSEKMRKQVCASFALSLLRCFHTKKISPSYKPYLEIASLVAEYFEALSGADMRRACEEMYIHHCAHEQDDI